MKIKRMIGSLGIVSALALSGLTVSADVHADSWWNCTPLSVFEFTAGGVRQLNVGCSNAYPPITTVTWAGAPLTGTGALTDAQAARFVSMAEAAIVAGRTFRVHVNDASACAGATNCRYVDAWSTY